jgi:hypothetical protein
MQTPPLRRGGPAQSAEAFTFDARLENVEATVDAMLASMTRGSLGADAWERLCAAAQRDECLSELAFAFEAVSQGKRMKALAPTLAAEFLFQAGRFFGDVFGDEVGAVAYLERALSLMPSHAAGCPAPSSRRAGRTLAPSRRVARPIGGRRRAGDRAIASRVAAQPGR